MSSTISSSLASLSTNATGNATTGSTASASTPNTGNLANTSAQGTLASAGIGSGLNVSQLVSQLMSVAQAPVTLYNQQIASYQTELSAYGQLSAATYAFQTALGGLTSASGFQALTATPSNTTVMTATADQTAKPGNYAVNVSQLAQAQTLVAAGQTSTSAAIGTGASTQISFQFGAISGGSVTNGTYSGAAFTQDSTKGGGSVTIDSSNNSLQGIADAINKAGVGVTASLVNDGSGTPWRLSLSSTQSGAHSAMKISVSGDPALQSLLGEDPAGTQNLTQTQAAQSAALTVNGLAINSDSNSVSQAIAGVKLNLTGTGASTVTVAQDNSAATTNVQAFVQAYNTLQSTVSTLAAPGGGTGTAGPLAGQFNVEQVQTQLRRTLSGTMTDVNGNSGTLADVGITFQKDGSLALDSTKLASVLSANPGEVASLFAQNAVASDSGVKFVSAPPGAAAGKYAITVGAMATQGSLTGSAAASTTITAGSNDGLTLVIDGVTASLTLPAGTYTPATLASAVQGAINGNATFSKAGVSATVSQTNGVLGMTSTSYGGHSFVSAAGSAVTSLLGGAPATKQGTDISGTINGLPARGSGQTLIGLTGSSVDGISVQVTSGSSGARGSLALSQGFANVLNGLAGSFNGAAGLITGATNTLNSEITSTNNEITRVNQQLSLLQATYTAQFTALDTTIASLNSTQSYLTGQFNSLASTTSYIYSNAR